MIDYKIRVEKGGKVSAGTEEDYKGEIENDPKLKNLLKKIGNGDNTSDLLETIGKILYDMIITDKKLPGEQNSKNSIREDFEKTYEKVLNKDEEMRIRLKIEDENYNSYPWELLHDGEQYLCLGRNISIIRIPRYTVPNESKPIENNIIKILIIVCVPEDEEKLENARNEAEQIKKAFRSKFKDEALKIDVMSSYSEDKNQVPTPPNIIKQLENKYNIIHFIGHSDSDEKGELFLLNSEGKSLPKSDKDLSEMFTHERTKNLGLVVLNSCKSGVEKGFSGLSRKLIGREIPCVVGMQFNVMDDLAPNFAYQFYDQLITSGFVPEKAILSCRENLYQFLSGPEDKQFSCPVIYLALNDSENGKILSSLNFQLVKRTVPLIDDRIDREKTKNPAAIIGIAQYANGLIPLSKDIKVHLYKLKDTFKLFETWKFGEFKLRDDHFLISDRATLIQIRKLISEIFRSDNKSETILLYFTGLFFVDKKYDDEAYLIPHDLVSEDPFIAGISFNEFKETVIKCANTSRIVLILDCSCTHTFGKSQTFNVVPTIRKILEDFSKVLENRIIIFASLRENQNIQYNNNDIIDQDSKLEFTSKLLQALKDENSYFGIINMLRIKNFFIEKEIPNLEVFPTRISDKLLSDICLGMTDDYQNRITTYIEKIKDDLKSANSISNLRDSVLAVKRLSDMLARPEIQNIVDDLKVNINEHMDDFKQRLEEWLGGEGNNYKSKDKLPEQFYNKLWELGDLCNFDSILELEPLDVRYLRLDAISGRINNSMNPEVFIRLMRDKFQEGGQKPKAQRLPSSHQTKEIPASDKEISSSGALEGKVTK